MDILEVTGVLNSKTVDTLMDLNVKHLPNQGSLF